MVTSQLNAASKSAGSPSGFRSDIQGLRALAVLGVVLYHAGVSFLPGGYTGVDVFFVISGFLITTHLVRTLQSRGIISFADFYLKRARRILPASVLVLVATTIAAYLWIPRVDVPGAFQDAAATALYVPNIRFAVEGTDYLAETAPSPFQHYWSLGIEEQFYLIWPAVLAVAFLAVRKSVRGLFAVAAVMVLGSFSINLFLMQVSTPWAFFSLPSRAWELGVGAMVALLPGSAAVPVLRAARPALTYLVSWASLAPSSCSLKTPRFQASPLFCRFCPRRASFWEASHRSPMHGSCRVRPCRRSVDGPTRSTSFIGRC